eukprot:gnl/TRDRNA2_/TRDRNA2_190123_c0_seq1.p1 gnl/TRDRNA2_/TRDRNA2_190123_c0~~gnl/TRDRNA2_/TRDRNA2_190123_c0_seq1.p1  ORF type:complete len:452 (+),score=110.88 gnl/TRDRNA2_/TRDRNA2_190123_c0_seq1:127-1482(+)
MGDKKPGISLAVVGLQGCGKTSALAYICQASGAFAEAPLAQCQEVAKELGRPNAKYSWMLDTLATERDQGMTVSSSMQKFESDKFCYTGIDTPGRSEYVKNMLSVTSLADVAVLVISAAAGEFEEGINNRGHRELALCCFTMGIKHIVVLVTKMDHPTVQYSSARFEEIKKAVSTFLKDVGYKSKDGKESPFVPISGLGGDNIATKSSEMDWYTGLSVVETLDTIGPINRPAEKPLRIPVLKVHDTSDGTVVIGRVETGSLRRGIKVIFSPGGQISEVKSIQVHGQDVHEAKGGEIVGFKLGDNIRQGDIQRGMVAAYSTEDPTADAETFMAQVVVLDHPGEIRVGYCPSIAVHTAQVPCEFEELISKIDRKTGKESEANPASVKTGEVVTARLRPRHQVCVEAFSAYPSLGRFAVRDHQKTIAVGVIKEVTKKPIPKIKNENANQYFEED